MKNKEMIESILKVMGINGEVYKIYKAEVDDVPVVSIIYKISKRDPRIYNMLCDIDSKFKVETTLFEHDGSIPDGKINEIFDEDELIYEKK